MLNRRHFLRTALLTVPTLPLLARSLSPLASGKYNVIRGNVGYYTNRGGTIGCYLPGGKAEGGVIVDTQFAETAGDLVLQLKKMGELNQFQLLVNTHHHGDHTSGNGVISPLARLSLIHDTARINLEKNQADKPADERVPLPKESFKTSWSTNSADGQESITVRHFGAAHTGGDAVVHFENANVAHVGDLLFNRRFPYVDASAGADILNWIRVMKSIRQTYDRNTIFIFGHAAEGYPVFGTVSDIKAFENYLKALRRYVRKEKRRGTTLDQLRAKTKTIPGAAEWNSGERQLAINLELMYAAV